MILREEEPVVEKRVVPRERVRLDKDTVTGEERVAEEVRKEQIEVHHEDNGRAARASAASVNDRFQWARPVVVGARRRAAPAAQGASLRRRTSQSAALPRCRGAGEGRQEQKTVLLARSAGPPDPSDRARLLLPLKVADDLEGR